MRIEKLVCCCCSDYKRISQDKIKKLCSAAKKNNIQVELIPDLCLSAIENPEIFISFAEENTVLALCHFRVADALSARTQTVAGKIIAFNDQTFFKTIENLGLESDGDIETSIPVYDNPWQAWYPLIDRDRCTNCGKCIDFCLFGVYSKKNNRVIVAQPAECKTNCPACSRVCPQKAIIFPKHDEKPFNGAPIEESEKDNMTSRKANESESLYNRLAARRKRARQKLLKD